MKGYIQRPFIFQSFDTLEPTAFETNEDVSNLIVEDLFENAPADISCLCFSNREPIYQAGPLSVNLLHLVTKRSLIQERIHIIRLFLIWLMEQRDLGISKGSIRLSYSRVTTFFDWCDNSMTIRLKVDSDFCQALNAYFIHVRKKAQAHIIRPPTYLAIHSNLRRIFGDILKPGSLIGLHRPHRFRRGPELELELGPPSDEMAAEYLQTLDATLKIAGKLITGKLSFPFVEKIGDRELSFFPHHKLYARDTDLKKWSAVFLRHPDVYSNFTECRVSTTVEVEEALRKTKKTLPKPEIILMGLARTRRQISEANSEPLHKSRIRFGNIWLLGHAALISAATGMNVEQLISLDLEHVLELPNGRFHLSGVKGRAGGRHTEYTLSKQFSRIFRDYLSIRDDFLGSLNLDRCEMVFPHITRDGIKRLKQNFSSSFHKLLTRLTRPELVIHPQQWRLFKSVYLISHFGPLRAAAMLQHKPSTLMRNYARSNWETSQKQLNRFFEGYHETLNSRTEERLVKTKMGLCRSIDNPENCSGELDPIQANCMTDKGCLWCQNFRIHADQEEAWRLLSFKFVFGQTHHLDNLDRTSQQTYLAVEERVEDILEKIEKTGKLGKHGLQPIRHKVEVDQNLHPTWNRKLELLVDLGAVC